MKHMQRKCTSILGALSQPGATLDADSSWAVAVALCSAVETLIDLQLRISRLCIPHALERLACVLGRRSARRSAVGADESRGSAAWLRTQAEIFHAQLRNDDANRAGGARAGYLKGRLGRRDIALTLLCESLVRQCLWACRSCSQVVAAGFSGNRVGRRRFSQSLSGFPILAAQRAMHGVVAQEHLLQHGSIKV